jgi:hypothetical protein
LVPHWVNVAKAFDGSIDVSALNCADAANRAACDAAHVTGYPTIQCFGCPKSSLCKEQGSPGCDITVGFPPGMSEEMWIASWIQNATGNAIRPTHPEFLGSAKTSQQQIDIVGPPRKSAWVPGFFMDPFARSKDAMRGFLSALWSRNSAPQARKAVHFMNTLLGSGPFPAESPGCLKVWNNIDLQTLENQLQPDNVNCRAVLQAWASAHSFGDLSDQQNFATLKNGMLSVGTGSYKTCTDFTCALWEYLHVTTVLSTYFSGLGSSRLTPQSVMDHIRWFVAELLECLACKHHFIESYDQGEFARSTVQDWKGMVLWLWRTHEGVTLRTAADSHAPGDRRWPPYSDCPNCWRADLITNPTGTASLDIDIQQIGKHPDVIDKPFDLNNVYNYLVAVYLAWSEVEDKFELPAPPGHHDIREELRIPPHYNIQWISSLLVVVAVVGVVASITSRWLRTRRVQPPFVLVEDADVQLQYSQPHSDEIRL